MIFLITLDYAVFQNMRLQCPLQVIGGTPHLLQRATNQVA